MTENKIFYPDKDLNRFEFAKRILVIYIAIICVHFISMTKYAQWENPPSLASQITVEAVIAFALTIWVITSKVTKELCIDFEKKKIVISYLTLLRNNKKIEIDFSTLNYVFNKAPNRYNAKRWILEISRNNKKIFSISTGDDGFSQETLQEFANNLKNITNT